MIAHSSTVSVTNAVSTDRPALPNPHRVAAGRRNRALRQGLTEAGRERLRQSALRFKPWRLATGPKSAGGKAQVVKNGKVRQIGQLSIRERRALLAALMADLLALRRTHRQLREALVEKTMTPE